MGRKISYRHQVMEDNWEKLTEYFQFTSDIRRKDLYHKYS